MINIRQSELYCTFMESLGWKMEQFYNVKCKMHNYVFIRQFPVIGSFVKILRIKPPIPFLEIEKIAKRYRAFKIQIEPDIDVLAENFGKYGYKKNNSPLTPTKTILIDLTKAEKELFQSFTPEKRRAVRRAEKNNIVVKEFEDISSFVQLKNKQLWPFGFLLSFEIKKLWEVFHPEKKAVLLFARHDNVVAAGVLLLFHEKTAYYWLASATSEGKKLFAPTLLVWEAIKYSKKMGYKIFDFEGIEDERFKNTKNWEGFSRFKLGFGGKVTFYAGSIQKSFLPAL